MISGVDLGGVRALGPSRARISAALALVRPFRRQGTELKLTAQQSYRFKNKYEIDEAGILTKQ